MKEPQSIPRSWMTVRSFIAAYKERHPDRRAPLPKTVQEWCKRYFYDKNLAAYEIDARFGALGRSWRISPRALGFVPSKPGRKKIA